MSNPFRYFNSSPEVIGLVVMMYVKYPPSLRNVEDLLAERGIDISHETVRFWWNRFKSRAAVLRILLLWMAAEGIMRFAEIDRRAVGRFTAWLRDRPGHRSGTGVLTPLTMVNYMIVLKDLYRQRAKLDDAPLVDPLPIETTYEAAGVTRENKGAIPFIPDAVAIDLLSKALT